MSVSTMRDKIDGIDAEVARLLRERAALSARVQEIKAASGLPPLDPRREGEVIAASAFPEVTAEILRASRAGAARSPAPSHRTGAVLGGGFAVIAGPCSAEGPDQLEQVAAHLAQLGVRRMRAGAWKPRTRRSSFQGHGAAAVRWMREVCDRHGLELWTEVRDAANIPDLVGAADVVWIGARNCQCFELLELVGQSFPRVVLKRGAGVTVEEWVAAAEYVSAGGAAIVLCERGIRSFDPSFRNTLDLAGAVWARRMSGLEVIVDVSHSTGLPALAAPLAAAAAAAGLDGVMAEAHPRPRESVTDADQALSLDELSELVTRITAVTGLCSLDEPMP